MGRTCTQWRRTARMPCLPKHQLSSAAHLASCFSHLLTYVRCTVFCDHRHAGQEAKVVVLRGTLETLKFASCIYAPKQKTSGPWGPVGPVSLRQRLLELAPFDFVFLDHQKALYLEEIQRLEATASTTALISLGVRIFTVCMFSESHFGVLTKLAGLGAYTRRDCHCGGQYRRLQSRGLPPSAYLKYVKEAGRSSCARRGSYMQCHALSGRVTCGCAYANYVRSSGHYHSRFFWGSRDARSR